MASIRHSAGLEDARSESRGGMSRSARSSAEAVQVYIDREVEFDIDDIESIPSGDEKPGRRPRRKLSTSNRSSGQVQQSMHRSDSNSSNRRVQDVQTVPTRASGPPRHGRRPSPTSARPQNSSGGRLSAGARSTLGASSRHDSFRSEAFSRSGSAHGRLFDDEAEVEDIDSAATTPSGTPSQPGSRPTSPIARRAEGLDRPDSFPTASIASPIMHDATGSPEGRSVSHLSPSVTSPGTIASPEPEMQHDSEHSQKVPSNAGAVDKGASPSAGTADVVTGQNYKLGKFIQVRELFTSHTGQVYTSYIALSYTKKVMLESLMQPSQWTLSDRPTEPDQMTDRTDHSPLRSATCSAPP